MTKIVYAVKTFVCKVCSKDFEALHGSGRFPAICSKECRAKVNRDSAIRSKTEHDLKCEIDGCGKLARSRDLPICNMHYHRHYRTGQYYLLPKHPQRTHDAGYILLYAPHHPLTLRHTGTYEYQHRVVYYDKYGWGPFVCHICGNGIGWDTMHVDHLNDIKDDNRIENLAPACPTCNTGRARGKCDETLREQLGIWIEFNGVRDTTNGWARRMRISRSALMFRMNNGWSIERTLTEPRGKTGPQSKVYHTQLNTLNL